VNTPPVTLLVADDARRSLAAVLPDDAAVVDAAAVGDAVARDAPDVVVVDANGVADPDAVVEAVRTNADGAAVVVVGAPTVDADVACTTTDEASVLAAVERARKIAAYRNSVSDLYAACRERALGSPDEELRERRRDADEQFGSLPDDRNAFAAALRPEDEDG